MIETPQKRFEVKYFETSSKPLFLKIQILIREILQVDLSVADSVASKFNERIKEIKSGNDKKPCLFYKARVLDAWTNEEKVQIVFTPTTEHPEIIIAEINRVKKPTQKELYDQHYTEMNDFAEEQPEETATAAETKDGTAQTKAAPAAKERKLSDANAKELVHFLTNFETRKLELYKKWKRDAVINEVKRRGLQKMGKELGWSVEPSALYVNNHTQNVKRFDDADDICSNDTMWPYLFEHWKYVETTDEVILLLNAKRDKIEKELLKPKKKNVSFKDMENFYDELEVETLQNEIKLLEERINPFDLAKPKVTTPAEPFITGLHGCSCHPFASWKESNKAHRQVFEVGAPVKDRCKGHRGIIHEVYKGDGIYGFVTVKLGENPSDIHQYHVANLVADTEPKPQVTTPAEPEKPINLQSNEAVSELIQDLLKEEKAEAQPKPTTEPELVEEVDGLQQIAMFPKAEPVAAPVHDPLFGYLAKGKTDRQRFKRKLERTRTWLQELPPIERKAILKMINQEA